MRQRHLVGVAARLHARAQGEEVEEQERDVPQALSEDVRPPPHHLDLGDVGGVGEVELTRHGDRTWKNRRWARSDLRADARSAGTRDGRDRTRRASTSENARACDPSPTRTCGSMHQRGAEPPDSDPGLRIPGARHDTTRPGKGQVSTRTFRRDVAIEFSCRVVRYDRPPEASVASFRASRSIVGSHAVFTLSRNRAPWASRWDATRTSPVRWPS